VKGLKTAGETGNMEEERVRTKIQKFINYPASPLPPFTLIISPVYPVIL
jgi:hypothetical protein